MLQLLDAPRSVFHDMGKLVKAGGNFISHKDTNVSDEVSELIGDSAESSAFLPLLGMGRDIPEGVMSLAHDNLAIDWAKNGSSKAYFDRVRKVTLPALFPAIFLGVRVAAPVALVITLLVEILTRAGGIGAQIATAQRNYLSGQVYGLILLAGLFSLAVNGLVSILESYVFRHRPS